MQSHAVYSDMAFFLSGDIMGMTASLYSVSEQQVDTLRSDPAQALTLLTAGGAAVDLDKAWHGIHYLLTGSAWEGDAPLNFLLHGGEPLGDEDGDELVPRVFDNAEVRQVDAALSPLDANWLRGRYDPQAMQAQDIYPDIWDQDEALPFCLEHFGALKDFVAQTARQERGMVIFTG
jgi:hypothetical protein